MIETLKEGIEKTMREIKASMKALEEEVLLLVETPQRPYSRCEKCHNTNVDVTYYGEDHVFQVTTEGIPKRPKEYLAAGYHKHQSGLYSYRVTQAFFRLVCQSCGYKTEKVDAANRPGTTEGKQTMKDDTNIHDVIDWWCEERETEDVLNLLHQVLKYAQFPDERMVAALGDEIHAYEKYQEEGPF